MFQASCDYGFNELLSPMGVTCISLDLIRRSGHRHARSNKLAGYVSFLASMMTLNTPRAISSSHNFESAACRAFVLMSPIHVLPSIQFKLMPHCNDFHPCFQPVSWACLHMRDLCIIAEPLAQGM